MLWVALGGALGSVARYGLAALGAQHSGFPWMIIAVNTIGSFTIALVAGLGLPEDLRVFLTVGVLGGFTTYATFNQATLAYLHAGAWGSAALNVGLTLPVCLIAGALGAALARSLSA